MTKVKMSGDAIAILCDGIVYILREDKTLKEWAEYVRAIKLKPGMEMPRFHEFFKKEKINK